MLTYDDEPTVKRAIQRRFGRERGVRILDIHMLKGVESLSVGVSAELDGALHLRGMFELPPSFDYRHLHDEIDQLSEQAKEARRDFWLKGRPEAVDDVALKGTGLRGLWARHA